MGKIKALFLICVIISFTCLLTGCWNYREIEQLSIVAGAAIDTTEDGRYLVTVEIVRVQQDTSKSSWKPVYIQETGETIFDAVRKMVEIEGRKLYWSHTKVIIISEDIVKSGISQVMDFLSRDPELREDMWILLSREKSANAIFYAKPVAESIMSFELDFTLRAQKTISRYPAIELYRLLDMLASKNVAAILPTVRLSYDRGKTLTYVSDTAIIKGDKLVGFLNYDESKALLWVLDELEGGLFIVRNVGKTGVNTTLEIIKSKTYIKPKVMKNRLFMEIDVVVDANIAEIMGHEDFIGKNGRGLLKEEAEKQIKESIENIITKAQKEFEADIFGFGEKTKRKAPGIWKSIGEDWEDFFPEVEPLINVNIRLNGSGIVRTPTKVGK